jgi:hypothetical protein
LLQNKNGVKTLTFLKRIKKLTYYLQVPLLAGHRNGVDLTHVPSPVGLLDISEMQKPRPVVVECDGHPLVLGNNLVVNAEDGLSDHLDPGHLEEESGEFYVH